MDDFRTPEELFKEKEDRTGKNLMDVDINKYLPVVIIIFAVIFSLKTLIYSVGPDETAVVQRFGKFVRVVEPGLHMKIPFGVEKATKVKVKKIFKEEFGFRTISAGVKTRYSSKRYLEESLKLTGDLNILDVRWIVQFKVEDPVKLLFKTRNPVENVRDISQVVMSRLCGDYRVDELLTTKREEVAVQAQQDIQALLDKYETGIQVVTVKLLDVNPPEVVKPAFNEVNEAKQEKERMINEARKEYNKIIPRAKGEALRTVSQAEGYALDRVNRADGDAGRFLETWKEYTKAPAVTKKRMYLETLTEVMPHAGKKYIIDSSQRSILPLFDITKEGGSE